MLYSTEQQINTTLIMLLFGIICGIIFLIIRTNFIKKDNKKIIIAIFHILFTLFCGIVFIFLINKYYYGKINFVFIISFILGMLWSTKTLSSPLAFIQRIGYNLFKTKRLEKDENGQGRK